MDGENEERPIPEDATENAEAQPDSAGEVVEEAPAEVPEAPAPRRGCKRFGEYVVVVAVIGVVVAVLYYWPELGAILRLQPWSQRGPREALKAYEQALRANDVNRLRALLPEEHFGLTIKDGRVTHITPKSVAQSPPIPVKHLLPVAGGEVVVRYDLRPIKWGAMITARCENGLYCRYTLRRAGGQWHFVAMSPHRPSIDTP